MSGTQSIGLVSADGTRGVVVAISIVSDTDPGLVGVAETVLCGG